MPFPRGNGGRKTAFLTEYSYNSYISYDHTNLYEFIRIYTNCTNIRMTEYSVIYTKFRSYTNIRMEGLFAQVWLFLAVFALQLVHVCVCVCVSHCS